MALGVPSVFKVVRYLDSKHGLAEIGAALNLLRQDRT
jgi:hypothetical protein